MLKRLLEAEELEVEEQEIRRANEEARELGWSKCIIEAQDMAQKSRDAFEGCIYCNASDTLDILVQDIGAAQYSSPGDDAVRPENDLTARAGGVRPVGNSPRKEVKPGPKAKYLPAILKALKHSAEPMKRTDLIQAVRDENMQNPNVNAISNAILKAKNEGIIKELNCGRFSLP